MVGARLQWLLLSCAVFTSAQAASDLLLEAELEPAQVHVLSQAVYRLRFLHAVDVSEVELVGPSAQTADFREIGSRVSEAVRDGRRYRLHERSYAVFPFASGALPLSGSRVSGRVPSTTSGRQAMRMEAPLRTLMVLPGIDADWLPAKSVTLNETWAPAFGTAQRRTLRIEAAGIEAAHLPDVQIEAPGMTVQAEPPHFRNRFSGDTNIGSREQSFLLVPAGSVTVPELQLRWWNVDAGKFVIARLPARVLQAQPENTAARDDALTPLALGALALGLLCLLCYRRRGRWQLRRSCRRIDLPGIRDGLLTWSAGMWPQAPPRTLAVLAERMDDPALRVALTELERALYGPPGKEWKAATLLALVRAVQGDARRSVRRPRRAMMDKLHRSYGMYKGTP